MVTVQTMLKLQVIANQVGVTFKDLQNLTSKSVRKVFYETGKKLKSDAEGYCEEEKHGRVYNTSLGRAKITKAGVFHKKLAKPRQYTASASGEAPAVVTGVLKRSIGWEARGAEELEFGATAPYARKLEYADLIGMTGQVANIAPRPFLSRAYRENKDIIADKIAEMIQHECK